MMGFEPLLWLLFLFMNLGLVTLNFIQFFAMTDLEDDYLNSYQASSRINSLVLIEYLLHAAFCVLFLLTANWLFFLFALLPAYINLMKFRKSQHLINVADIFHVLSAEKKLRLAKIGFYVLFFAAIMIRVYFAGTFSFLMAVFNHDNEHVDIRSSTLEF